MNDITFLSQIELKILTALAAFSQPPDLAEIARTLGLSTIAGQLKLSFHVDNLEKNGFMKYNRAWQAASAGESLPTGWNLTPKGWTLLADDCPLAFQAQ